MQECVRKIQDDIIWIDIGQITRILAFIVELC